MTPIRTVSVFISLLLFGGVVGCAHHAGTSATPAIAVTPAATQSAAPTPAPTARPASASGRLAGKTVAIDPGHNGGNSAHTAEINRLVDAVTLRKPCDTTGTATNAGYAESAYNFDVAMRLAGLLRQAGARVVLTRTTDSGWGPCITERAAIGNRAHADAAVSIHADGGPAGSRGFHVIEPALINGYTDAIVGPSKRLGLDLRDAYHSGTGMPFASYISSDGIDVRSDLGGLNWSKVPKVFVECGNMRNATDAARLTDPSFRARAASALAHGLENYFSGR